MTTTRTDAPWRAVHRAADSHIARFVDPILQSTASLKRKVALATIEVAVVQGGLTRELADAIDRVRVAKIAAEPHELATKVYSQIMVAAVQGQAAYIEGLYGPPAATIVGRFDIVSPQVLRAAETLTATLIREVSAETKMAVRRIIFNSVRDGIAPRDAAKLIRQILGLTTRQALAVDNLRKGVLERTGDVLLAERQGGRYAEKLLRVRAENIARTETMRAATTGQDLLWSQLRDGGVIPSDARRRWLTTPDDRLCPRCAPMNGREVQLGFVFRETERGVLPSKRVPVAGASVLRPPLHPRCRCVLTLVDDLT